MKKLFVLLLALLLLVGCTGGKTPSGEPTVEENNYSMIATFDLTTFDYVYNNKSSNGDYLMNFTEGLVGQDSHGKLIPAIAESWSSNPEATEWTFKIREGANWSTSEKEVYAEVTANDFVTGLRHAADSQSQTLGLVLNIIEGLADYASGVGSWEDVGVKATDDHTLVYTLTEPVPYFDSMTTYSILYPINQEFLEAKGEGCKLGAYDAASCGFGAVDPSSILYNGPYILTNFTAQSVVEFDRNENYWDVANIHVPHVTVTYTDGSDPAQGYNMFKAGETTATGINESLADVVADAEANYADNIYLTDTSATTFWGAFNFNRRSYSLVTDPSKGVSVKTDEQKESTRNAILNKWFRLAVYAAFDAVKYEEITLGSLAAGPVRNTLTPWSFVTLSDGTAYGQLVQNFVREMEPEFFGEIDLTDGHDAWHSEENAKAFIAKAVEELGDTVTWPVNLEIPSLATSDVMTKRSQTIKASIEAALGDYVEVTIQNYESSDAYYYAFYDVTNGNENSIDLAFGAGWGPDYADPKTYLYVYEPNSGDMMPYSGLNQVIQGTEDDSDRAAKEAVGLYEFGKLLEEASAITDDNDARWTKFAEAEATLLVDGILRPFSTSGANRAISRVVPYTATYGLYGQAAYNVVPNFRYMVVSTEPRTLEAHNAAKEAWLKGE